MQFRIGKYLDSLSQFDFCRRIRSFILLAKMALNTGIFATHLWKATLTSAIKFPRTMRLTTKPFRYVWGWYWNCLLGTLISWDRMYAKRILGVDRSMNTNMHKKVRPGNMYYCMLSGLNSRVDTLLWRSRCPDPDIIAHSSLLCPHGPGSCPTDWCVISHSCVKPSMSV